MQSRDDGDATHLDPVNIELWCPHGPEIAWQVVSLTGRESLSSPFAFELVLLCEDPSADIEAVLGADAELLFERSGLTRAFYGIITEVQIDIPPPGTAEHEGLGVRVKIAPAYELLDQQLDTRFHAGQTVIEILAERLGEALGAFGRELDVESRISGTYNARDYCVQFRETTYDFCNRLMAEEGIAYMFVPDPDSQREVMVLVDHNEAYAAAELLVPEPVIIATHAPDELDRESIQRLDWRSRRTVNRVVTRGHNYKQPARYDEGEAEDFDRHNPRVREHYVDGQRRQITDDPVGDPDAQSFTGAELDQRANQARVLLQQVQRDATLGHGRGNAIGFAAGTTFELAEAPRGVEAELLIVEVTHQARRSDGAQADAHVYGNHFVCMPRSRPYRPVCHTDRPRVHGVQTGVVVGRGQDEVHTDALGRVRVRFHADRRTGDDEHRSCWIRVAQMWAGPGYGSMVIPRVGMEVVISFVDGNPDCPLITGCVYDGVNSPPRPLPAELSRSTFKTSTTPGGEGYNELMFEDAKGHEQIFMHAQGRMDMRVRGSLYETVGGSREEQIGSASEATTDTGNLVRSVSGNDDFLSRGSSYHKVEAESFRHTDKLFETALERNVFVEETTNFSSYKLAIECGDVASIKAGEVQLAGSKTFTVKSGDSLILESNNEIGLKVGQNFIHVSQSGVAIGGTKIRLNSGGHVAAHAKDGVSFTDFDMLDPLPPLAADDGRPGGSGGGGGGGGRRTRNSRTTEARHAPPMTKPKVIPSDDRPGVLPSTIKNDRLIDSCKWADSTWCSEQIVIEGEFDRPGGPWQGAIAVVSADDGEVLSQSYYDLGTGETFSVPMTIHSILPRVLAGGDKESSRSLSALVDNVHAINFLRLRFLSDLPVLRYTDRRARFDVWMEGHTVKIGSTIKFKRGWIGYVIRLTDSVPEGTGGVSSEIIHGTHGWRHCMPAPGKGENALVYHDGTSWVDVPKHWKDPLHTKLSGNALWREGGRIHMQYLKDLGWPDSHIELIEWTDPNLDNKLAALAKEVHTAWSGAFDIKRRDCHSDLAACCGYPLECEIRFVEVEDSVDYDIILTLNRTRANASAWPLEPEPKSATTAHEFGHHLGNRDEYPGATSVNPWVNGDGATAGIDEHGLMGDGNIVRRRYLQFVCKALGELVKRETGMNFSYEPMEKGHL